MDAANADVGDDSVREGMTDSCSEIEIDFGVSTLRESFNSDSEDLFNNNSSPEREVLEEQDHQEAPVRYCACGGPEGHNWAPTSDCDPKEPDSQQSSYLSEPKSQKKEKKGNKDSYLISILRKANKKLKKENVQLKRRLNRMKTLKTKVHKIKHQFEELKSLVDMN